MKLILRPTTGPEDWRSLLADPERHWRSGCSAHALAHCWEAAEGLPRPFQRVLETSAWFRDFEMLVGIPEVQVALPGGSRPSQTDLWVLGRVADGLVSVAVEGKVSEPFGPTVDEWRRGSSPGKQQRLAFLLNLLGIEKTEVAGLRYQLLHRTASAILMASRFHARHAVMVVHSFSSSHEWYEDYRAFAHVIGGAGERNATCPIPGRANPTLSLAWVSDGDG